ncbi:protein phosphatase 2C domain-containing protein [Aestuariibacter sp. A3R04]|uniref:PP2C family protein-serine/threonine phosphatase n=1 Tax=Aestuariibacter sp. A3R04 TaxID=2841571 RepID=UPI001C083570|nr:protein phosphatase 2C domain-containing protein [Aestuariibacter sp. A3R04]
MPVTVVSRSDVGKVRKNNEDAFWFAPLPEPPSLVLSLVSDGVGGKEFGEIASAKTCDVFEELVNTNKLKMAADPDMRGPMLDMSARRAHQEIAAMGQENKDYAGMACTLVCVLADEDKVGWVCVGDSRIYHWRSGELSQISEDQTVAMALYKEGRIQQADIATHPDKNTLMYCLGVEGVNNPIAPDSGVFYWQAGDKILLCSDGLTDMVDNSTIASILAYSPTQALDALIGAALAAGGKDNITVSVLENTG